MIRYCLCGTGVNLLLVWLMRHYILETPIILTCQRTTKLLCVVLKLFLMHFFSPAFQRFAVRTSKRIEDVSNLGNNLELNRICCFYGTVLTIGWPDVVWRWLDLVAVKKRQELAEQMKDLSKNFEVCCFA